MVWMFYQLTEMAKHIYPFDTLITNSLWPLVHGIYKPFTNVASYSLYDVRFSFFSSKKISQVRTRLYIKRIKMVTTSILQIAVLQQIMTSERRMSDDSFVGLYKRVFSLLIYPSFCAINHRSLSVCKTSEQNCIYNGILNRHTLCFI